MITLQNILFPRQGICTDDQLYFRCNDGAQFFLSDGAITFNKNGTADFDTYFNGIMAEKIFKYTVAEKILLKLKLSGKFRVTLLRKEKLGSEIFTEIIGETIVCAEGDSREAVFDFNCKNTSGMYCFSLTSLEDGGKFLGGEYYTDIPAQKIRRVKIGIDICTFKREKFVEKNVNNLSEAFLCKQGSPLYGKLEIFISDNAKTLPEDMNTEFVHVFKNKNVGGAGGFTRGLIEMIRDGNPRGITHALIMDDDIVFDPEVVYRTFAFLSLLKENYAEAFIGGAMLRLDKQNIQVESGAIWDTGAVNSLKHGLDLETLQACLYNELEESADYNAWWYSVVPIEYVRADNLPLPIFIRGDDAEYGLRNTKKLILLNGICVWHEPFENKYSSVMYYYIFRNRMIDNSVRGILFRKKRLLKELKEHFYNELLCLKYKNAELLLRGVEDYFRGIDWLKAQDGEKLHREIIESGYKLQYADELSMQFSYPKYENNLAVPQDKGFIGLIKRTILYFTFHGVFLPATRKKIVPTIGASPRQMVCTKKALHYDIASKKGFVTEKSVKKALSLYFRYRRAKRLIRHKYKKMQKEYNLRAGEITSLQFWNEYLGINADVNARQGRQEEK